jgi:signal transduction histidine kinase
MRCVKTTWLNSLQLKVLLAYIAGAALSSVLIVLVAFAVTNWKGDILTSHDVADITRGMARNLRFHGQGVPVGFEVNNIDIEWAFDSLKQETAYRVLDASGKVVLSSAAGAAFWPESGDVRRLEQGQFAFEHGGVAMRGATQPVEHQGRTWYMQFAASTRFLQLMYRKFALPFTSAGILLFSVVLLFVFSACVCVMLRYALKPLRDLSHSAAAISPRSLHARLPVDGVPGEIAPLVDSFNRVLERVEQGYRVQQEFLATAAHELKTPLALIRAQVELGEASPQRDELLRDVEHMTRHVQQLLHLAEASEAQNYQTTVVDVHAVAQEAAGYLQRKAGAADVRLDVPTPIAAVRWLADRGALFTLLKNLIENAIQHAPAGTHVSVELDAATLSVRDRGPGVEHEHLAKIFGRFWRGAHRRDEGAGLGLTICQEIALAHGWTLVAQQAEPGLRVVLSNPVADTSPL